MNREVDCVQVSGLIMAEAHFKGCTRLRRHDSVDLPAFGHHTRKSSAGAGKRQLIAPVRHQDMLDGKARKSSVGLAVEEINRVLRGIIKVLGVDSAGLINGAREGV